MLKAGMKVTISRLQTTQRQATMDELAVGSEQWITSKPVLVKTKGVLGNLARLNVVVTLADGDYRGCKYVDLTHLKGGKVSFKSKKADWKGIKKGVEVLIPGKEITLTGTINWHGVFVPVLIGKQIRPIPFEQINLKKESK